MTISKYLYNQRNINCFQNGAGPPSDGMYSEQVNEFSGHEDGFRDRDLKVFHLFEEENSFIGESSISHADQCKLREQFGIGHQSFTAILIGKDGTEKLRVNTVLATSRLFKVIDAMQMRQREMRNDNRNN